MWALFPDGPSTGHGDRDIWNKAGAAGLLCVSIPEAYGGGGGHFGHEIIVNQAHAAAGVGGFSNSVHSGTGKEVIAHALHTLSPRQALPLIAFNCAAVPHHLLECELFGHVKGAFTDARSGRPGLFIEANGGTLLLDEVGEMPLEMQAKLLRALQERTVRPVGGDRELPFDARVIAATHQELDALVEAKTFREDLFYRIAVVIVPVPTSAALVPALPCSTGLALPAWCAFLP